MATKNYINPNNPVYISYSWANINNPDIEKPVEELCARLESADIYYRRDKTNLAPYRHEIEEAEKEIGNGAFVIVVLSEKYLKSLHCLYELHCVMQHEDWKKRVYPIILDAELSEDIPLYFEFLDNKKVDIKHKKIVNEQPLNSAEKKFLDLIDNYKKNLSDFKVFLEDYSMFFDEVQYDEIINQLKAHVSEYSPKSPASDSRQRSSGFVENGKTEEKKSEASSNVSTTINITIGTNNGPINNGPVENQTFNY